MEDSRIVDLYWQRDQRAVEETQKKYDRYCYSIAHNILENVPDAEEAVNDTWLGAWNSMPPHRPSVLSAYLGKLTRRVAIKKWQLSRAAKRGGGKVALALEELSACIPGGTDPQRALEGAELSRVLRAFVDTLKPGERRVFIRRYWYLDSLDTIAADLGYSLSKVKSMLFRMRNKLRDYLKKEGYDL